MKYGTALVALAGLSSARQIGIYSRKVSKREVPQEHSHEAILRGANEALKLDNPLNIQDAVFALLGNAAAADGAGDVTNLDCLQQIIADQAFTNAKAAGDLELMTQAILYRALERNTGEVGLASVLCNETATNPEIANIQQHQDPASPEAVNNAQIELEVAKSLASIGADPLLALQSATFPPGEIGDPTAQGNSCNDPDDPQGCIFTLDLLTPAVTEEEILAAVADITPGAGAGGDAEEGVDDGADDACEVVVEPPANDTQVVAPPSNSTGGDAGAGDSATGTVNIQTFTGSLGGVAPPVESVANSVRPFSVNGATFTTANAALQRSCAIQKNACANAANSGEIEGGVGQCEQQEAECRAANNLKMFRRSRPSRRQVNGLDFGSCGSPAIQFAEGLDGRTEASFQNVNTADFDHGSAQNIAIIADFTCSRLQSSCGASQETVEACQQASQAAQAADGQAAADTFNSALGVSV